MFNILSSHFFGFAKVRDQLLYAKVIFVKIVVLREGKRVCEEMFSGKIRHFTSPLVYVPLLSPHTSLLVTVV